MSLLSPTASLNIDDLQAKRGGGPGRWERGRIIADVTSPHEQRDVSPAGNWNRKKFGESLGLLRSLNLPTSAIDYCQRRARETGRLPEEFMTEIVEARRQRLTMDSLEPLPPQTFAEALPGGHVRPDRQGGGTRSQLTAEGVLLSVGLVVVAIGIAVTGGGTTASRVGGA